MFKKSMKNSTKLTEWYLPSGRLTWRLLENTLCSFFFGNVHWRCTFGYVSFCRPGILLFVGKDSISKPPMGCSFCVDSNTKQTCLSFSGKINHQQKSGKKWLHNIVNHNSNFEGLPSKKKGVKINNKMIQNSERYPTLEPTTLRRACFDKGHIES